MINECSYEMESRNQTIADLHMEARTVAVEFRSKFNQTGDPNSCVRLDNDC